MVATIFSCSSSREIIAGFVSSLLSSRSKEEFLSSLFAAAPLRSSLLRKSEYELTICCIYELMIHISKCSNFVQNLQLFVHCIQRNILLRKPFSLLRELEFKWNRRSAYCVWSELLRNPLLRCGGHLRGTNLSKNSPIRHRITHKINNALHYAQNNATFEFMANFYKKYWICPPLRHYFWIPLNLKSSINYSRSALFLKNFNEIWKASISLT